MFKTTQPESHYKQESAATDDYLTDTKRMEFVMQLEVHCDLVRSSCRLTRDCAAEALVAKQRPVAIGEK